MNKQYWIEQIRQHAAADRASAAQMAVAKLPKAHDDNQPTLGRPRIALDKPDATRAWCQCLGCTEAELRTAVKAVGTSLAKVRAHLGT
jgi:hypothetical protein